MKDTPYCAAGFLRALRMDPWDVLTTLGVSLGLGLLVGLQREYVASSLAGIRTFALITLFGTLSALLAHTYGGWTIGAGAIALVGLLVVGNLAKRQPTDPHVGMTTEVAAMVMYGVGAYLATGTVGDRHVAIAVALGGTVALLLQLKQPLHRFVQRLGDTDIKAIMQFVLIALVILPILPNRRYGPDQFKVFNPFETWMVVVLIVAIGLGGYVAYKMLGERVGMFLSGVLGGVISSTATTVSYARCTASDPRVTGPATFVVMLATAVSTLRVLVLTLIMAPSHIGALWQPLAVMVGITVVLCGVVYLFERQDHGHVPAHGNPAQLRAAVIFALMYALVKFGVAGAKHYLGTGGLYGLAAVSGLTDLDAIVLSMGGMVEASDTGAAAIAPELGWRLIVVAIAANLLFKTTVVGFLGTRRLLVWVGGLFGVAAVGAVLLVCFWK